MGKVIMNKKLILLFLLFLTTLTCSSKIEKPIPEKQLEGWAGNPHNPNEKPFDYFYMSHARRASQKAILRKSGEMMNSTCTEQAALSGKGALIRKMIGEIVPNRTSPSGQLHYVYPINNSHTLVYPIPLDFHSQAKKNPLNSLNLIAITTEESKEFNPVSEFNGRAKRVGVKDCKPLSIPDPKIPYSEWKECECSIYIHFKGGKEALIKILNYD
jgi:hypothetical protein